MADKTEAELLVEWRDRLITAHRRMQRGMAELIDKRNYEEAAAVLGEADRLMIDLIADAKGLCC